MICALGGDALIMICSSRGPVLPATMTLRLGSMPNAFARSDWAEVCRGLAMVAVSHFMESTMVIFLGSVPMYSNRWAYCGVWAQTCVIFENVLFRKKRSFRYPLNEFGLSLALAMTMGIFLFSQACTKLGHSSSSMSATASGLRRFKYFLTQKLRSNG